MLRAASQGYSPAQNDMGMNYRYGCGVEQDYVKAVYWYEQAVKVMLLSITWGQCIRWDLE
ncbi:hypothetical protein ACFO26_08415 [Lactococcus nasutitermitis]|uniref:Sel1 repeat family protein n=1 Tax=Lactococcus nasutitermitis TaxID=1652957 RepID=A0ABV9JEP4_9LACT|nr:hypothetical protein [Lactococcus nasutitermitis]